MGDRDEQIELRRAVLETPGTFLRRIEQSAETRAVAGGERLRSARYALIFLDDVGGTTAPEFREIAPALE